MEYALVIMYLWAGATVAWAMRHVEEIGAALNEAMPDVFPAPQTSMRQKGVAAAVILGWPLVLPVWLRMWHKERSNARVVGLDASAACGESHTNDGLEGAATARKP